MRKEQFKRPEPGFSMYEGRTRGKRVKYTYSDDEDIFYSDSTNRRSARNTGANTPAAESGPVTTASGRQIRAPPRMNAGDDSAAASVQGDYSEFDQEGSVEPSGRPRRSAAAGSTNGWGDANGRGRRRGSVDSDDAASEGEFGDDEEDAHVPEESDEEEDEFDDAEAMVDDDIDDNPKSLVVKLAVTPPKLRTALSPVEGAPNALLTPDLEERKPSLDEVPAQAITEVVMEDSPAPTEPRIEGKEEEPVEKPVENKAAVPVSPKLDAKPEQPVLAATPASPAPLPLAPLAFRGSPEKKHVQPAVMPDILNAP